MHLLKSLSIHFQWISLAAITLAMSTVQAADTMYKYISRDGSTHYSDHKESSDQYTLLETKVAPSTQVSQARTAGVAYKYVKSDGSTHYTDKKERSDQYKLVATFGRPTASVSCSGLNESGLSARATAHMPLISSLSKLYDVDERLIQAIIRVESCFDINAVSRVGAKGLMQLMPATAEEMGVTNVFDADDNIRGGMRYFGLMMERFENNTEFALAAYNAGPEAVVKYKGIPPYRETQDYVRKVLKHYQTYLAAADTTP